MVSKPPVWGRVTEHSLPHSFPEEPNLLPSWFYNSSLQNWETIYFCCYSLQACGTWHGSPSKWIQRESLGHALSSGLMILSLYTFTLWSVCTSTEGWLAESNWLWPVPAAPQQSPVPPRVIPCVFPAQLQVPATLWRCRVSYSHTCPEHTDAVASYILLFNFLSLGV